jgi:hypothetical protein
MKKIISWLIGVGISLPALAWLIVALSVPIAFTGCNRDTIPEIWDWTVSDSVDIMALLEPEEGFLTTSDFEPSSAVTISLDPDTLAAITANTAFDRYWVSSVSVVSEDSFYGYEFDLGIDTTVTCRVVDTLKGNIFLQADSVMERGATQFVVADTQLTPTLRYSSWSYVFFDSLGGEWRIAKYSGGGTGTTPDVSFSPQIDSIALSYPGGSKMIHSSSDTSVYSIAKLMETGDWIHLDPGDQITIDAIYTPTSDTLLFFVSSGGDWTRYEPGTSLSFSSRSHLYIIGLDITSIVMAADEEWKSIVWGIPVRVNP